MTFPQLLSGTAAQYPLKRRRLQRTERNEMRGGAWVRYADSGAGATDWSVPLSALGDAEVAALSELFENCEGRLGSFLFLDPGANLLTWSGDFSRPCWQVGAMLQCSSIAGPAGMMDAVRVMNAGQAAQRVSQALAVPSAFQYVLSFSVRGSGAVSAIRSAGGHEERMRIELTNSWQQVVSSGVLGGSESNVDFAVELEVGTVADIFGMQVEAQVSPSEYMPTASTSGIYSQARFDMDEWTVTAQALGRSDVVVRIVSTNES